MASNIVSDGFNIHKSARNWSTQKPIFHVRYLTCTHLHSLGMSLEPSSLTSHMYFALFDVVRIARSLTLLTMPSR